MTLTRPAKPVGEAAATNWFIWALGALSVEAALGVVRLPDWCYRMWAGGAALLLAMGSRSLVRVMSAPNSIS